MKTQSLTESMRTAFEFQRSTIELSETMAKESLDRQQAGIEALNQTLRHQRDLQDETFQQWEQLAEAVMQVTEQSMGPDLADAIPVQENINHTKAAQREMWESLETLMTETQELTAQQQRSLQALIDVLSERHHRLEEQVVSTVDEDLLVA